MKKWMLALVLFSFSSSAWGITGLGIGIHGGMIQDYTYGNLNSIPAESKDWLENMPTIGAHLKIGTLPIIDAEVSMDYAWKKKEIVLDETIKADFSIHDLSFNGTVKYILLPIPVVKPYIGAGVGLHRLVYGISNDAYSIYIPDDQNQLGWHVVGGAVLSLPVFPIDFFVEARYTNIPTTGKSTHYTTFLGGVTYNLP
jgi:hypothetical protein